MSVWEGIETFIEVNQGLSFAAVAFTTQANTRVESALTAFSDDDKLNSLDYSNQSLKNPL